MFVAMTIGKADHADGVLAPEVCLRVPGCVLESLAKASGHEKFFERCWDYSDFNAQHSLLQQLLWHVCWNNAMEPETKQSYPVGRFSP